MVCSSSSVGLNPSDRIMADSSLVVMMPLLSRSNRENASLYSTKKVKKKDEAKKVYQDKN